MASTDSEEKVGIAGTSSDQAVAQSGNEAESTPSGSSSNQSTSKLKKLPFKQGDPIFPENNPEGMKTLFDAFAKCQTLQRCGLYLLAFMHYQKLIQFLSTDALLWLRIAECCVYARYKKHSETSSDQGNLDDAVPYSIEEGLPDAQLEALDDIGMTMEYAEIAIVNCEFLMEDPSPEFMLPHVKTLAAFIYLKTGRFPQAQNALTFVFEQRTLRKKLLVRACLIQMHVYIQRDAIDQAISLYERLAESSRAECKKHMSETIRKMLKISS